MGAVASLVLIGTTLLLFVLVVAAVGAAARRRWHRSLTAGLTVGLLVALYAVALVGVSVTTPDRGLTSQRDEVLVPGLGSRLASGSTRNLPPVRLNTPAAERPLLRVTEGGSPSVLVIGDDNSPFHPQPAWQLT